MNIKVLVTGELRPKGKKVDFQNHSCVELGDV